MGTMGADAMVVYAKGTALTGAGIDRNVYYRLWDSSVNDWGAEQTAQQVSANSSPVFIVVRFARTRNEAIMGVLDGNRQLFIQVWNGRTWTIPAGGGPLDTASTNTARTFQIAYEYTSDIARIVYQNSTRDPQYATWNGTTLTANGMILPPANTYPTGGGARHMWFRLAPRNVAGSNDILMISLDDNRDTYGLRWTGAAWNNMGDNVRWDTSVTNNNLREAIDVAWQSNGTLAVFAYGDGNPQRIGYRTWNATTSTLNPIGASSLTTPTFPGLCASAVYEWFTLYPDNNNNILTTMQTANRCLVSTVWSGGAFGATVTEHDGTNTVESAASRSFDFAWEKLPSSSGKGWLLWGSGTSAGIRTKYFTSTATWGAPSTVRDRTLLVQGGALSPSGRFVGGAYHSTAAAAANRITESLTITGGGTPWLNAATTLWGPGPVTTLQQGERVFVVTREGDRINTGAGGTGVVSILETHEVMP